jgi:hypothetical protein
MLRESQKALLYLEHEAQLAAPKQLTNFPRTTMSLPKTALTAIFLLSVCSPALAETATKDTQAPVATSQPVNSISTGRSDISQSSVRQQFKAQSVIDPLNTNTRDNRNDKACRASDNQFDQRRSRI